MSTRTQTQQKTVWPTLVYEDARGAIRFLVDTFGFEERITVPSDDDPAVIVHAQLRWPEGGGVMLSSVGRDGNVFSQRPIGSGAVYVVTDDPDRLYAQATAAGLPVVQAIQDEDYGGRGFSVRDVEGNLWSFGSYRGE